MQSLKELYKIGSGPSSSHTLAPQRACKLFVEEYGLQDHYKVELYGSLSLTGKGHMTDLIIENTLEPAKTNIIFKLDWEESFPNGFYIKGFDSNNKETCKWTVFSIGGGSIKIKEKELPYNDEVYKENSFQQIKQVLKEKHIDLIDYVYEYEPDLKQHLLEVVKAMIDCVNNGLDNSGILPGSLKIERCAKSMRLQALTIDNPKEKENLLIMAYAYAASEENASGHTVVTSPTLGACGVLAAIVKYYYTDLSFSRDKLANALAIGGIFGNLIKQNATISGAVGGCQAEVGTACSMGAAMLAYLNDLGLRQIEYAAEIGMEHNLGLTCDPVGGYVIIPCIERNAMGVLRSINAMELAKYKTRIMSNRVSFDTVVHTMNYTGNKIARELKETSMGGLAKEFANNENH